MSVPSWSLALVSALASFAIGCSGGYSKVSESDVDPAQKATASALATRVHTGCRTGRHEPLGEDEAIPEMRDALSPSKLATTCAALTSQLGDFVSAEYTETWKPAIGSLRVYRFKGHFTRGPSSPEIRVVMDGAKLSGFWVKPWADALQ